MRYYLQAKGRMNIMLFARLKEVSSGKVVCVGTYHMPCMFWLPSVMVMHTALVSQRIKALAGNDPHVLAGDFNFKPDSSMYQLITEARLDESHPEYPDIPDWEPWRPTVPQPMHSAYKYVNMTSSMVASSRNYTEP
jgi:endonuclease/exonuclease/phosphatase family metal-dependent hydrolase